MFGTRAQIIQKIFIARIEVMPQQHHTTTQLRVFILLVLVYVFFSPSASSTAPPLPTPNVAFTHFQKDQHPPPSKKYLDEGDTASKSIEAARQKEKKARGTAARRSKHKLVTLAAESTPPDEQVPASPFGLESWLLLSEGARQAAVHMDTHTSVEIASDTPGVQYTLGPVRRLGHNAGAEQTAETNETTDILDTGANGNRATAELQDVAVESDTTSGGADMVLPVVRTECGHISFPLTSPRPLTDMSLEELKCLFGHGSPPQQAPLGFMRGTLLRILAVLGQPSRATFWDARFVSSTVCAYGHLPVSLAGVVGSQGIQYYAKAYISSAPEAPPYTLSPDDYIDQGVSLWHDFTIDLGHLCSSDVDVHSTTPGPNATTGPLKQPTRTASGQNMLEDRMVRPGWDTVWVSESQSSVKRSENVASNAEGWFAAAQQSLEDFQSVVRSAMHIASALGKTRGGPMSHRAEAIALSRPSQDHRTSRGFLGTENRSSVRLLLDELRRVGHNVGTGEDIYLGRTLVPNDGHYVTAVWWTGTMFPTVV